MVAKTVSSRSPKKTLLTTESRLKRFFPWLLVVGGVLGILSAATLTVEKIHLLKDPGANLVCDLNPIVACGSVINTPQASAFGFPNPIIGLVGFGVVTTVGMAILAGATFRRWFWLGLQAGTLFGVGFVTWLQFQSIYRIDALCPFCMVVWAVTIPIFVFTTAYNIRAGHLVLSGWLAAIGQFIQKYPAEIVFTWYLIIIMAILEHFWYYWSTLL